MSTLTLTPATIPAVLPRTLDQVRAALRAELGTKGIPNAHWPVGSGQDCLGFLTWGAGIRPRDDLANALVSIEAFRVSSGWHEIRGHAGIRPGDWVLWDWDGDGLPDHAEFVYSLDRQHDELTTDSANTGPKPGVTDPRGVWEKTRPLSSPEVWGAIRPPYANPQPSASDRATVRKAATYLNATMPSSYTDPVTHRTVTLHRSGSGDLGKVKGDGIRGPFYRLLVQAWGRTHDVHGRPADLAHAFYGETYKVDSVFGPRSDSVEELLFRVSRAG